MNKDRAEQIDEYRRQIPERYRALYDLAMTGTSRKAAMKAFCLGCVGWEIKEVHRCTSYGCTLHAFRPRSRVAQGASEDFPNEPECLKPSQTKLGRGTEANNALD